MIEYVKGNILDAKEGFIFQQVNCQGVMGSGLAKAIRNKYPIVYECYSRFCAGRTPEELLGSWMETRVAIDLSVICVFGQLNFGRDGKQYTNYSALFVAFMLMKEELAHYHPNSMPLLFPYKFGCGLGGGDWNTVLPLIEKCFSNRKIIIYQI